jgi:hypothetical protein
MRYCSEVHPTSFIFKLLFDRYYASTILYFFHFFKESEFHFDLEKYRKMDFMLTSQKIFY